MIRNQLESIVVESVINLLSLTGVVNIWLLMEDVPGRGKAIRCGQE